ncbi:peptide chain release factor N(5)-glutamine methyltransferase [Azospira restricta]|uniref:Release factor glutamine methyltransferase n=1 Tax=Azospira restricta TaxID=404405 RepID=A0A974Y538_9RHOO|nr:peptide chain release factor N(5)-glutamine methyltransferase [Azospira restricta]QRJ65030.1 peptide chain release factor N(5)-glutamine methyltransferase [Azospira restricta]
MSAPAAQTIRAAVEQVRRRVPRLDARLLMQHLLGITHAQFLADPDRRLSGEQIEAFMTLVLRRERGEPVAYLVGEKDFYSRSFKVTPAVLIPRPDTELIVTLALKRLQTLAWPRVLDLGTGSGAIAVTLACEHPEAAVLAVDVSPAALAVARENAARLGGKVGFVESDWFSALADERFDLIVANPPYVAARDPHLSQDGLPFEPDLALTDGADGLSCIRRIVAEAPAHLVPGGLLLIEHGYDQGAAVRALLAAGPFADVCTWQDLSGNDRVSGGCLAAVA